MSQPSGSCGRTQLGSPLFPAGRPGALGDHALALRSDCARLLLAEAAAGHGGREVVLVLPAPGAVRFHRDVERVVAGIPPERRRSQRILKVDVPACEYAVAPEQPERVRVAEARDPECVIPPHALAQRPVVRGEVVHLE
jgi:hypothetical protein